MTMNAAFGPPGRDFAARGDRARRLAEREFNLSFGKGIGDDNEVVAGRFWSAQAPPRAAEISVEQEFAESLGWKIGDRVGFDIAGQPFGATITSLRRVEWESFRPNFFVTTPDILPVNLQGGEPWLFKARFGLAATRADEGAHEAVLDHVHYREVAVDDADRIVGVVGSDQRMSGRLDGLHVAGRDVAGSAERRERAEARIGWARDRLRQVLRASPQASRAAS